MIHAVHQNITDLTLAVFAGHIDNDLTVLKQARFPFHGWVFSFAIIGESHRVMAERGGVPVFSELLACVNIPPAQCVHHHRYADLLPHEYRQPGYSIQTSCTEIPPQSTLNAAPPQRLEVAFPSVAGQTPITRIEWQSAGSLLRWQTLHVYPQTSGTALYMHSLSCFDIIAFDLADC